MKDLKKLILLTLLLLMGQLCFSEIDTLSYPKIVYPGSITKDTCVEFTIQQAKQAAIDGINADSYKEELDSCKHVVSEYQKFVNLKNKEISNCEFKNQQYNLIVDGYKEKEKLYNEDIKKMNRQLKMDKIEKMILYPTIIALVITTVAGFLTK